MSSHSKSASKNTSADPHGRDARHPLELPAAAWRDIAQRIRAEFDDDRVLLVAAGATFYILLALVPALAAMVALYGLVFDRSSVAQQMASLTDLLPAEARSIIGEQLQRLTSEPARSLGFAFAASLAMSVWSASSATKGLMDGLNIVYDETERRSFLRYNATALAITVCGLLAVLATLGVTIVVPVMLKTWPMPTSPWLASAISYALLAAVLWLALIALYRWAPNRREAKWRWLAPGTIIAVVLLAVFSAAFSWFARTFAAYASYGSIGAVIGFMTWCWVCVVIVLAGAEINAEMEHQTARDSTVGAEKPIGMRGAVMADTVGATAEVTKAAGDERRPLAEPATARPGLPVMAPLAMLLVGAVIGAMVGRRS